MMRNSVFIMIQAVCVMSVLVLSFGTPAFAQTIPGLITVDVDKEFYQNGETVVITGNVRSLLSLTPVTVIIIAPNGNVIKIAQETVDIYTQTFGLELVTGGPLMKQTGLYTVKVQYGDDRKKLSNSTVATTFIGGSAVTTFGYYFEPIIIEPPVEVIISDVTISINGYVFEYYISSGKLLDIIPSVETKTLTVLINAPANGTLTLTIPRIIFDSVQDQQEGEVDIDFIVFVDSRSADFNEANNNISTRTLVIPFLEGAEEIKIVGTHLIPEFGTIAFMILAVAIIAIIAISAKSRLAIIPRYKIT